MPVDRKLLLVPGAVLTFCLVSLFWLVLPQVNQVTESLGEVSKKEKRLTQLTTKADSLEKIDQSELLRRARFLSQAVPTQKEVTFQMMAIRQLSRQNNLELLGLSVKLFAIPICLNCFFDDCFNLSLIVLRKTRNPYSRKILQN